MHAAVVVRDNAMRTERQRFVMPYHGIQVQAKRFLHSVKRLRLRRAVDVDTPARRRIRMEAVLPVRLDHDFDE